MCLGHYARHSLYRHPGEGRDPRQLPHSLLVQNDAVALFNAMRYLRSTKSPCVYILASKRDGVLYIGVTSDLHGRMAQHDQGLILGFTKRYGVKLLVYYEFHNDMTAAIRREKQLKEWRRAWKVRLIESMNPEWRNLFDPQTGEIAEGLADKARQKS
jgi:putative endonuclease